MTGTSTSTTHASGGATGKPEKHVHHGRTPAAWAGTILTSIAFVIGAIGLVLGNWPIFWAAVGLIVVALIIAVVLQKMGHGAY